MVEYFEHIDQQLLLFINGIHTPFLDTVMWHISKIKIFIPLFFIWALYAFRILKWKKFILFGLCLGLLITLSDQSANVVKDSVKRYRPTHNLTIGDQVHIVKEYKGGTYGFYSAHAGNTFAIATFLFLFFRKYRNWCRYTVFPFAILASYSRMYLGVHYPFDILMGALSGIIYGILVFKLFKWLSCRFSPTN